MFPNPVAESIDAFFTQVTAVILVKKLTCLCLEWQKTTIWTRKTVRVSELT